MNAHLETDARLWLNESELAYAVEEMVEILEVACSCGDIMHARHLVRRRMVTMSDPLVELIKEAY